MKTLKLMFGIAGLTMGLSLAAGCSDPINQPPDNGNKDNKEDNGFVLSSDMEGVYEGADTMSFTMLSGVNPYTVDRDYDTMNIVATGNSLVSITYASTLTHPMMGETFRANVSGTLTHVTLQEDGDSVRFSNLQIIGNDTIVPDSMNATMGTPNPKLYPASFTGALSKTSHLGKFHINTEFGAMGKVHFVYTVKRYTARQ